ncbi:hypothetical protein [Acinetobacter ursingii]|uniref:hypothetical protein n=1 Tax=Acinetobacter ursingii TaxID=108980 RepID=UPI001250061B|nr:hypothetical protein [Acinetobacter ursingii]MCU4496339.1 hypothetical protein [Acinetobacter ursingii]UYF78268.1 hypothetical protein LSO59_12630 [Acinetobacter ursingii]
MSKYITSAEICERFRITKQTLNRWEKQTQWGLPFPAPALPSNGGCMKQYLLKEVNRWERLCTDKFKTAV